jgi:hypothetical protein
MRRWKGVLPRQWSCGECLIRRFAPPKWAEDPIGVAQLPVMFVGSRFLGFSHLL